MAHIVPSDISRLALSGGNSKELDTLQQLKTQLPNDYTVFHGVHWSREYEAWTHFGEIDFVVLNRAGKVLFIEQKNGALQETGSGLVKHYDDGDKDIAHQLQRSINKVREKFQWTHGKQTNLAVDYLFYCPDYRVKNLNAVGLSASRIVDATGRGGSGGRASRHCWSRESLLMMVGTRRSKSSSTRPLNWYRIFIPTSVPRRSTSSTRAGRWQLFSPTLRCSRTGSRWRAQRAAARACLPAVSSTGKPARAARCCWSVINRPLADRIRKSAGGVGTDQYLHGVL